MRNLRSATPPASFTHRAEAICTASVNDIVLGLSSASRTPTDLCHFASRSRATRGVVFGSRSPTSPGANNRISSSRTSTARQRTSTALSSANRRLLTHTRSFENGGLCQNIIDVLFGFARRAARIPQKDVRMEEVMAAIGLTRARIRLEKGVHLKFHYSLAVACSRLTAS